MQYLTVPVDLPDMKIVHTVSLQPVKSATDFITDDNVKAVGQLLAMKVSIRHTRRWGHLNPWPVLDSAPVDFGFEVQANSDTWLIGGQRKACFSAREDEVITFALLLLPQKTGHLPYPSLDIQPIIPRQSSEDNTGEKETETMISCEVDYREHAQTIYIVPGMSSTTVSLDPSGSIGGAWLVEAKGRRD